MFKVDNKDTRTTPMAFWTGVLNYIRYSQSVTKSYSISNWVRYVEI